MSESDGFAGSLSGRDAALGGAFYLRLRRMHLGVSRDPRRMEYMDLAMTSITDEEVTREIFQTKAAQAFLGQQRRLAEAPPRCGSLADALYYLSVGIRLRNLSTHSAAMR